MAINPEDRKARLKESASKSLKLMQLDKNGTLSKISKGKYDAINAMLEGKEGSEIPNIVTENQMSNNMAPREINPNRISPAAGNVPSIIRESFQTQPPVAGFGTGQIGVQKSVLDDVFGDMLRTKASNTITEESRPQVQQTQSYGQQIDYPMIRTIVEEIVRKYTGAINKKLVNESKTNGINMVNTIALGDKFKFLTENGDIYECQMTKIGNINKKKVNG